MTPARRCPHLIQQTMLGWALGAYHAGLFVPYEVGPLWLLQLRRWWVCRLWRNCS